MNRIKALLCAYDALLCEAESAKSSKQRVEAINTADVFREEISQLIAAEVEEAMFNCLRYKEEELISLYAEVYCGDYCDLPEQESLDITELLIDDVQQFDGGTLYLNVKHGCRRNDFEDISDMYDEIDCSWAENGWLSDDDYIWPMLPVPASGVKHLHHDTVGKIQDKVYYDKVHDITWEDIFAAEEYYASVA